MRVFVDLTSLVHRSPTAPLLVVLTETALFCSVHGLAGNATTRTCTRGSKNLRLFKASIRKDALFQDFRYSLNDSAAPSNACGELAAWAPPRCLQTHAVLVSSFHLSAFLDAWLGWSTTLLDDHRWHHPSRRSIVRGIQTSLDEPKALGLCEEERAGGIRCLTLGSMATRDQV